MNMNFKITEHSDTAPAKPQARGKSMFAQQVEQGSAPRVFKLRGAVSQEPKAAPKAAAPAQPPAAPAET